MLFGDTALERVAPHRVAGLGIARTFQNIELFEHATVLDNLLIGRHCHRSTGLLEELFFLPRVRRAELADREAVEKVIDLLDLAHYREARVAGLPYGVRKVVELGRALAVQPKLLLLDEPSSGLNTEETDDMAWWIRDIKEELGDHRAHDRARHEPGRARVGPRARAQLRKGDRERHARRSAAPPRGGGGLSWRLNPFSS